MLQNVDEIISQPFPVNRAFKGFLEGGFKELGLLAMAGLGCLTLTADEPELCWRAHQVQIPGLQNSQPSSYSN